MSCYYRDNVKDWDNNSWINSIFDTILGIIGVYLSLCINKNTNNYLYFLLLVMYPSVAYLIYTYNLEK